MSEKNIDDDVQRVPHVIIESLRGPRFRIEKGLLSDVTGALARNHIGAITVHLHNEC